jgi:5'-3' exonuclease
MDISVTYGVIKNIESLLKKFHPKSVIFCQDGGSPQYRYATITSYKSNRDRGDEDEYADYIRQLNDLKEAFGFMGIVCIRKIGSEGDDIVFHSSRLLQGKNLVVSGDKDLLQTVDENTDVLVPIKDLIVNVNNFEEIAGIARSSYVDWRALQGDSSDNVAGVPGIGPVNATKLISQYKDISGVWNAATGHNPVKANNLQGKLQESIVEFGWERLVKNIYVTVLAFDRTGARQAIMTEIANYRPASKQATKKWLLANAFVSLLELPTMLTTLVAPQIKVDIFRAPTICGRRSPL